MMKHITTRSYYIGHEKNYYIILTLPVSFVSFPAPVVSVPIVFVINGRQTYSAIYGCHHNNHAANKFVQGKAW